MQESETLTVQNQSLKGEIQKLEQEKLRLVQVLSGHENSCLQRMQQNDNVEIKHERLSTPMDEEDEYRVPCSVPAISTIAASQESISAAPGFPVPVPNFPDPTGQVNQSSFLNTIPANSNPNLLPYNISNPNQTDDQPLFLMTSGHEMVGTISPRQNQPPSFDDASRIANEIKVEDNSNEPIIQNTIQHPQMLPSLPPIFDSGPLQHMTESQPDFFRAATFGNHSIGEASSYFLAKRPLGHTYLDLDSRCIAL